VLSLILSGNSALDPGSSHSGEEVYGQHAHCEAEGAPHAEGPYSAVDGAGVSLGELWLFAKLLAYCENASSARQYGQTVTMNERNQFVLPDVRSAT
jgi:hypothetical protein